MAQPSALLGRMPDRGVTPAQKPHPLHEQKEHMLAASPTFLHHGSQRSVLTSARCSEWHGCGVSVQKEHSEHLHIAHCVVARRGLHNGPHPAYMVSPGWFETHFSRGGGGGGASSTSKPSQ